jgi:methionyl-tRNA synthetase
VKNRRILLTAALPYANGPIHLGHLVEYLQADFWTRFQKMRGHECHYICADDTHGTAIMVEAKKRGITPEALVDSVWKDHTKDFADFQIQFSHYSSTNSQENREMCELFWSAMKSQNHIATKSVDQLYCEHDKMFLPDRFVKGTCPKCGAKDQYGDNCDVCGATYTPNELIDAYCSVCRTKPTTRSSDHLMFQLEHFRDFLLQWLPNHISKEMANKMKEWFNEPLRDWDISRDAPYFGFQIPGQKDKYFYVWVDAPMGYVSSSLQFCNKNNLSFDDFWKSEKTEVYHFIGKDIVYFHSLFWPALLKTAGFRTPTQVFVHGRLTINGEKMSKSKGTNIPARNYLNHLDPQFLRYYYASKLNSTVDDFDWSESDFVHRVNSDLIGKITNLGSRGAQMLKKKFDGVIGPMDADGKKILALAKAKSEEIAAHFEARDFAKAINEVRSLADETNRYFDEKAPWKTAESNPAATKEVLASTVNIFRVLSIYLKPILPSYAAKVEKLLSEKPYQWDDLHKDLVNHPIQDYEHLVQRVDQERVTAMMDESKPAPSAAAPTSSVKPVASTEAPGEIDIDAFSKVDLRVAQIIEAEEVKEADKLLRLKVDLGPLGTRQIFAGIKSAYSAATLVGRLTVVVANLKPRKMKFGMSEGMVLAAGAGGSELFILSPDQGAKPGDKVK